MSQRNRHKNYSKNFKFIEIIIYFNFFHEYTLFLYKNFISYFDIHNTSGYIFLFLNFYLLTSEIATHEKLMHKKTYADYIYMVD